MEMKEDNQFELNFKLDYLILILNHFKLYLSDVVCLKLNVKNSLAEHLKSFSKTSDNEDDICLESVNPLGFNTLNFLTICPEQGSQTGALPTSQTRLF